MKLLALEATAATRADQRARIVDDLVTTLLVGLPRDGALAAVRRLGEEVRPRVLELVG